MQVLPSTEELTELSKGVKFFGTSCPSSTLMIKDLVGFICIPTVANRSLATFKRVVELAKFLAIIVVSSTNLLLRYFLRFDVSRSRGC